MPENKFAVGDIVEWDEDCDFTRPEERTGGGFEDDDPTNTPSVLGYCKVVEILAISIRVEILSTGLLLARTSGQYLGKPEVDHWNPICFKKVDKFKYVLHEIYSKEST